MIVANLIGGLGNQMFQYACARALSLEVKHSLKFSQDMFGLYTSHNGSELSNVFHLKIDGAHFSDLQKLLGKIRATPDVRRLLANKKFSLLRGSKFIVEPFYKYWSGLNSDAQNGGYLQGYWQSERYFSAHENIIRKDFKFCLTGKDRNAELSRLIQSCESVGVHVRRGDYLANAKVLATHGICTLDYYVKAIESIRLRFPAIRLYVFSDDPKWVVDALVPIYPDLILVTHNQGKSSFNDMHLMSLCKHNIIANSSFSWWASWLNRSPYKIVIAPKRWFANDTDTRDLIPSVWERI